MPLRRELLCGPPIELPTNAAYMISLLSSALYVKD